MGSLQYVDRRTVLQTIPATLIGGGVVTGATGAARVDPRGVASGSANDVEIVAKHDEEHEDGHRFELSSRELSAGWTTLTFDNQTDHTHFAYAAKVPQAAVDAAEEENEDLRDYYGEHVTGPVQYVMDDSNPETEPNPDDLSDKYSDPDEGDLFPPWLKDFSQSGGVGLTSGHSTSMTTLNLESGDYIIECYIKDEDGEFHHYNGMVDRFTVTDERDGEEPEATIDLSLSSVDTGDDEENKGTIDVDEDVQSGQHTVAVHFEDSQVYPTGVGHDVHLIRLDETTSIDDVNGWMDWRDPNQLVSDGTEPGTFLGGVENISSAELMGRTGGDGQGDDGGESVTAYFHVDLNPGAYAWVSEVPNPREKGLMEPFIVPFDQDDDVAATDQTPEPTYSYEAITGVWTAETNVGRHEMAKIEFTTESATQDEEIGTMQLFREEGGEELCRASMLAHHSDPPSYWVDVEGENNPCRIHQRYRFQHNPEADELHWFISRTGHEAGYFDGPIMTREHDLSRGTQRY